MAAIWKENPELMIRLQKAQNHPAHANTDIMTFCAFFDTREELERHVEWNEKLVAEYVPPVRRRRKAA